MNVLIDQGRSAYLVHEYVEEPFTVTQTYLNVKLLAREVIVEADHLKMVR